MLLRQAVRREERHSCGPNKICKQMVRIQLAPQLLNTYPRRQCRSGFQLDFPLALPNQNLLNAGNRKVTLGPSKILKRTGLSGKGMTNPTIDPKDCCHVDPLLELSESVCFRCQILDGSRLRLGHGGGRKCCKEHECPQKGPYSWHPHEGIEACPTFLSPTGRHLRLVPSLSWLKTKPIGIPCLESPFF